MCIRHLKWKLPGLVLAVLLVGHGFAAARWVSPPPGQPAQIWSKVHYDPRLTDPFFKSNEWRYPWNIVKHPDGHFEDTSTGIRPKKEPPHLKHTAKCFSTSHGTKHLLLFCKARLLDRNEIDLFLYDTDPGCLDDLRVQIRNGMFTCQFSTRYKIWLPTDRGIVWKTTRQALVLDKNVYRKGDTIKGKIDFECLEFGNPKHPRKIEIYGIFKTVVK